MLSLRVTFKLLTTGTTWHILMPCFYSSNGFVDFLSELVDFSVCSKLTVKLSTSHEVSWEECLRNDLYCVE